MIIVHAQSHLLLNLYDKVHRKRRQTFLRCRIIFIVWYFIYLSMWSRDHVWPRGYLNTRGVATRKLQECDYNSISNISTNYGLFSNEVIYILEDIESSELLRCFNLFDVNSCCWIQAYVGICIIICIILAIADIQCNIDGPFLLDLATAKDYTWSMKIVCLSGSHVNNAINGNWVYTSRHLRWWTSAYNNYCNCKCA